MKGVGATRNGNRWPRNSANTGLSDVASEEGR